MFTEFGWSSVRFEEGKEVRENGHAAVKEHRGYRQTFVADERDVSQDVRIVVFDRADFAIELFVRDDGGNQ